MIAVKKHRLEDMLFLDIETVRIQDKLPAKGDLRDSWEYKMRNEDGENEHLWLEKAPLYAEFSKIACISLGKEKDGELVTKSYSNLDEKELLQEFSQDLTSFQRANSRTVLVGHSLKGFDCPVMMRRMIVNRLSLNPYLDAAHLKPWEINFILDISDLWKGTGFYPASLINIAVALGITHSKSNIDGSQVSDLYYSKKKDKIEQIVEYCEGDIRVAYEITKVLHSL